MKYHIYSKDINTRIIQRPFFYPSRPAKTNHVIINLTNANLRQSPNDCMTLGRLFNDHCKLIRNKSTFCGPRLKPLHAESSHIAWLVLFEFRLTLAFR